MGTTDEMPTAIKEKNQWDPISITYTKLFSKLIENGLIEPVYLAPLKRPFPIWYDANAQCDYHARIPGHSTENYNALKYKVQDLIKFGKLKFEESNEPTVVEDLFEAKAKMIKQEEKAPREVRFGKMTIPRDKVSIAKDKRGEVGGSLTTERSKERLCKSNKKEEKKML